MTPMNPMNARSVPSLGMNCWKMPKAKAVNLLKAVATKRHSKSLAKLADNLAKLGLQRGEEGLVL